MAANRLRRPMGGAQRRRLLRAMLASSAALLAPRALFAQIIDEFGAGTLKGAGSTFAHPLMSAWATEYRAFRKGNLGVAVAGAGLDDDIGGIALDYEAVGSQAGIQRVKAGAVDFAVSEMPLPAADLERSALMQVPLVTGAVAVAANLVGAGELRLSGAVIADIFLGRIKSWADPAIAQLNPGLELPSAPIAVVHRTDGSGTTYTFTTFLAQASAEWKSHVGNDLLVNWPVGQGFRGNAGVAQALQSTPNAIGYVNLVQAAGTKLRIASVQNSAGRFVAPSTASVQAAVAQVNWAAASRFDQMLVNLPGEGSYPIVAAVFGLLAERAAAKRRRMTKAFFQWAVTRGRASAERLGYVALPSPAAQKVEAALKA